MRLTSSSSKNLTYLVHVLGECAPASVRGLPDERIAAIAGRQRGRVRRDQLCTAGISSGIVDRRIASGWFLSCRV